MSKRQHWKLSASWIAAFKACTMRCWLSYIKGIRPAETTDALRMGSNWHEMLEVLSVNDSMDEAIDALDSAYENKPNSKTREEWDVERAKLAYSLAGYNWYHDNLVVVAREIPFTLKIINPDTGATLPDCEIVGKIDKIVKIGDEYLICEHKSTSKAVDNDSQLWGHLRLDTQTTLYQYAVNQLSMSGALEQFGIPKGTLIAGGLYDVWRKPTIAPKMLSQKDTAELDETGRYMDQDFTLGIKNADGDGHPEVPEWVEVNGVVTEHKEGKKEGTFAIRETPDMYGARLLADIQERPEYYFNRKPLVRSLKDMARLEREIYSIYKTAREMDKNNAFYTCEDQCEATFHCSYIPICYNNIDVDKYLPEGFVKRASKSSHDNL